MNTNKTLKVGDVVPYKNTRGNIKQAEIIELVPVLDGKVWFRGVNTVTKAKVWYPTHISERFLKDMWTCESCGKHFAGDMVPTDDDDNHFCEDCYKELSPVMKADYEELKSKGEL